jgi:hypothetical protein
MASPQENASRFFNFRKLQVLRGRSYVYAFDVVRYASGFEFPLPRRLWEYNGCKFFTIPRLLSDTGNFWEMLVDSPVVQHSYNFPSSRKSS